MENENDRKTEIPEDREAYERDACAATAMPEAVEATEPWRIEYFGDKEDAV